MHNKPYTVDASKITRVLPDFSYIPLAESVRAAADSVVAMGLAAFHPPITACCFGLFGGWGAGLTNLTTAWSDPAACAAASALASVKHATQTAAAAAAADGKKQQQWQHSEIHEEEENFVLTARDVILSAPSGASEGSAHEVFAVVVSPAGSEAKLPRIGSLQMAEIQGGEQQV